MKSLLAVTLSIVSVASAAWLVPSPVATKRTSIVLVDRVSGEPVNGVVRVRMPDDSVVRPNGVLSRGWGLDGQAAISDWLVISGATAVDLPSAKLRFEAMAGIETELTSLEMDLEEVSPSEIKIPLDRFSKLSDEKWFCANTHLHLRNLTREESDRYLREIPAADRLDALFISHLERAGDDPTYITNKYSTGRLPDLETAKVVISNGEEHRHNFGPQGEGFGHVMLLGIKERVEPVSIGFGISKKHPDWPPIRRGIDRAHEQGGTAIWCHNNWGFEDVPNWVAGRLDAQNIFDGGSHGSYEDSFYRYLNAGLRVPFSTGTDWFMYDFSRCYVRVEGELTPESWLGALRGGRSFITNGPLLDFRVNDVGPGGTKALESPGPVSVTITARGRLNFGRLELIRNGNVVDTAPARQQGNHYEASLVRELGLNEASWIAARVQTDTANEYGPSLFAHTSPVYITMGGELPVIAEDVRYLMGQVQSARSEIAAKGHFAADSERTEILTLYDRAIAELERKLSKAGGVR